jgi:hypothetical protein
MLVELTVAEFTGAENVIWIAAVVATCVAPDAGTIAVTARVAGCALVLTPPQPVKQVTEIVNKDTIRTSVSFRCIVVKALHAGKNVFRMFVLCRRLVNPVHGASG